MVDPQTFQRCADGTVGEICVQGPSVAAGYYEQAGGDPGGLRRPFKHGGRPDLRTGDLGFLRDGQLFVTAG